MIRSRLPFQCFRLLLAVLVVSGVTAQESRPPARMGLPEDWTHHHIIFSTDYLRAHPDIMVREPRALHQIYRRWGRVLTPSTGINLNGTAQMAPKSDWNVMMNAGTTAFGTSPAKYQGDPTLPPDCIKDFVVFPINALGVNPVGTPPLGQATIIAFNKLYTGAGGHGGLCAPNPGDVGGPTYIFSYNTSTVTNGRILTSAVLSLDGTKIAFVESSANGSALHVLQIGTTGSNGTNVVQPVVPGVGNNAKMATINYTTANNTRSSPWIDYPSDTLYVGANNGKLYKFTGAFTGTPTLVNGGGWPITITGNTQLTSPVFDSNTGNIFVGDGKGFLYSVNAITPGAVSSLAVGASGKLNSAIIDAPIVDNNGNVYATSSNDGTSAVVVQASTSNLVQKARINVGVGSTTGSVVTLYDGDFDNNFYNNLTPAHYLVCGTGPTTAPFRYNLTFVSGVLTADLAPVQISTSTTARCGPITEFFNPNIGGGTDYFFWGVTNTCVGASGCIMELANGSTVKTAAEVNGTSAVVIDNDSTAAQASNIYFASQGGSSATRLATKLQQNGLN